METLPKSASEDRRVRGLSNPYLSFSFTAAKVIFYFGKSKSFLGNLIGSSPRWRI
nr:MAG TPA: hypothetical protein [Caudoviricetes sp.]